RIRQRDRSYFARGAGPAGEHVTLDVMIARQKLPVGAAVLDRVTRRLEGSDCRLGGARTERGTEALVGLLMLVDTGDDCGIEGSDRIEDAWAVVIERAVERQAPRGDCGDQPLEPFSRDQVEQRGRGHEIYRSVERRFEIAPQIDRDAGDRNAGHLPAGSRPRE